MTASTLKTHQFDNGIKVNKNHLLKTQLKRYQNQNLHEPEEERIFLDVLQKLPQNEMFINVGAAIGYYLILAKSVKPGLHMAAFEPLASHRTFIIENFRLNGLDINDIELNDEVVSSTVGKITFREDTFCSHVDNNSSFLQTLKTNIKTIGRILLGRQKMRKGQRVQKKTTTIDRYLNDKKKKAGLIQIDVQGHEFEVLKGSEKSLENNRISYLLVGTHSHDLHHTCVTYLTSFNYQIVIDDYETNDQPDGILLAKSNVSAKAKKNKKNTYEI